MPDYHALIEELKEHRVRLDGVITGLEWLADRQLPTLAAPPPTRRPRGRPAGNGRSAPAAAATSNKLTARWAERKDAHRKAVEEGFVGSLTEYEKQQRQLRSPHDQLGGAHP